MHYVLTKHRFNCSACRQKIIIGCLLLLSCLLALSSCQAQKQIKTRTTNDTWSKQWSYQDRSWFPAVSTWLDLPAHTLLDHTYKQSPDYLAWHDAKSAVLSACQTTKLPGWLDLQLTLYISAGDADMTTDAEPLQYSRLHYNGVKEYISTDQFTARHIYPTVISLTDHDQNDDCAAIALFIAIHRYHSSFMIDLSHNLLTNRGVAYFNEMLANDLGDKSVEINLKDNPRIGPLAEHYLNSTADNLDNVRVHLDHGDPKLQKEAFARAIVLDTTRAAPADGHIQSIIFSQADFSRGTKGIKQIVQLLANQPQLTEIHLIHRQTSGRLDWSAAIALAEIIKPYNQLTSLSIVNQPIGDIGIDALINAIKTDHPHFHLLNISGTGISDAALAAMYDWSPPHSVILLLTNNPAINISAINQLSKHKPSWIIIH